VKGSLPLVLVSVLVLQAPLAAQDSTAVPGGVRVGITYTPGTRPAIAVLIGGGAMLDSVRTILGRDLDYSDRFEVVQPPSSAAALSPDGAPDYRALTALGTDFAVSVAPRPPGGGGNAFEIQLHDVRSGAVRNRLALRLSDAGGETLRRAVHRAADEVVRWATGASGIASTAILFVADGKIWRVDPDGEGRTPIASAGRPALSPAWSPDLKTMAYTAFVRSGQPIVLQDLTPGGNGRREVVPGTEYGINITPEFSPDGRKLAYAHGTEDGTDVYLYDLARKCCTTRLTVGRYNDNLSPAWSPDGQRIAFISTRAGSPQLYVMAADGTGQEALAPFDYGATGMTFAPEWSPDGSEVVFHREVAGTPQVFVLDLAARGIKQITGAGRNEDATWAPDSRHLCFVSSRSGVRLLWIVDLETGRMRSLPSTTGARLPAWSPRHTS
jgi:TolB protein